jgi:hypothetical protein
VTDHTLSYFRTLADAMRTEPTDWQWIGPHMSQRMFGITEIRAKAYAERHGGTASQMNTEGKRCSA